ncbi:MAG: hypothetical protein ACTSQB_05280, partial [Candidatus Heimdallarchaeota archaeon]
NPTYPWRDLIGLIRPDPSGANAPATKAFMGGLVRGLAYGTGDKIDMDFHIPHDYAKGTDLYIHVHWGHNGTGISGNNVMTLGYTYASRSNTPAIAFVAEKSDVVTVTTDITNFPQYCHSVDEIQLTDSGGTGNRLDTDSIEVDGIIKVNFTQTTLPTITGGDSEPFVFTVDIHYQSTGIGTKAKAPDFYT